MKRNRAALVTSVSTAMLGAGWAAGVVGTAVAAQDNTMTATVGAAGTSLPSTATSAGASASPSPRASTDPSVSASASSPATSAPARAPAAPSGIFDGAIAKTRYGNYQVEISVEAGKISNIAMLQSGANDGTSRQISGYALPRLIAAVLQTQTAHVGYVSGASYTSQGFEASVQDAMSQAGI